MEEDEFYHEYGFHHIDGMYGNNPYVLRKPLIIHNPDQILDTYTNWNSQQADKERTIFGAKENGLFYNYSDRLDGWDYEKARRGNEYAALVATPKTARFYAAMLSYFHDGAEVELRHIIAGCNRSNGFPYLVYGYKYEQKPTEDAVRLAEYDNIRERRKKIKQQALTEFSAKFDEAMNEVLKKPNKDEPLAF